MRSSKRLGKKKQAQNSGGKPQEQSGKSKEEIPATAAQQSEFQSSQHHCEITPKTEKNWWNNAKPYVEAAGVILLAVYTFYTIRMYSANQEAADAAKRAADTAAKALEMGQRAYVSFSPHISAIQTIAPIPKEGKDGLCCWQFEIPIINSGETPAREARGHVQAVATSNEIRADYSFKDFTDGENVLVGTKDTITMVTNPIAASDASMVYRGHGQIYVFGWMTYYDVFPNTPAHKVKFCYRVVFWGDPTKIGQVPPTHYFLARFHNCVDDQCDAQ